jgi:hypothetical protein
MEVKELQAQRDSAQEEAKKIKKVNRIHVASE